MPQKIYPGFTPDDEKVDLSGFTPDEPEEKEPEGFLQSYSPEWAKPFVGWAERPLSDLGTRIGQNMGEPIMKYAESENAADWARTPLLAAGQFTKNFGEGVSGLTSPLNLATAGVLGKASSLAKAGQAAKAGKLLNVGKALSVPMVAEGAHQIYAGNTWDEKLQGVPGLLLGGFGMRAKLPTNVEAPRPKANAPIEVPWQDADTPSVMGKANNVIPNESVPPEISPLLEKLRASLNADEARRPSTSKDYPVGQNPFFSEYYKRQKENQPTPVEPELPAASPDFIEQVEPNSDPFATNASGESAASQEAINRQNSMKSQGQQFAVFDRAGNMRPLIGPEAVDYVPQPGETYGIMAPEGFKVLNDNGGRYGLKAESPGMGIESPSMNEPSVHDLGDISGDIDLNNIDFGESHPPIPPASPEFGQQVTGEPEPIPFNPNAPDYGVHTVGGVEMPTTQQMTDNMIEMIKKNRGIQPGDMDVMSADPAGHELTARNITPEYGPKAQEYLARNPGEADTSQMNPQQIIDHDSFLKSLDWEQEPGPPGMDPRQVSDIVRDVTRTQTDVMGPTGEPISPREERNITPGRLLPPSDPNFVNQVSPPENIFAGQNRQLIRGTQEPNIQPEMAPEYQGGHEFQPDIPMTREPVEGGYSPKFERQVLGQPEPLFEEPSHMAAEGDDYIKMGIGDPKDIMRNMIGQYAEHGAKVATKELLQNALDALKGVKGGLIQVELQHHKEGEGPRIVITDNGPGLPIDLIRNEYTNLTSSGKRGKGEFIGEMGVGKSTYLLGAEKFRVETMTRETDGNIWHYTFEGTPDDMIDGKIQVQKQQMPNETQTGTRVTVFESDPKNIDKAESYLETFAKYSNPHTRIEMTGNRYKSLPDLNLSKDLQPRTSGPGKFVAQGSAVGGDYHVSVPDNAQWGDRSYISTVIMNRGMFQGVDEIHIGTANAPDHIVVDVNPTVSATDAKRYPLTSPTRERFKAEFKQEVRKSVMTNLVEASQQKRQGEIQQIYDGLKPKVGRNFVTYDSGGRYTPAELNSVQDSPHMNVVANTMKAILRISHNLFPTEQLGVTTKFGFLLSDSDKGGINIPNPKIKTGTREYAILMNPFGAMEGRTPVQAARRMIHITLHEFNHNMARSEGADFTWKLADLYTRFPLEDQLLAQDKIVQAISTPDGNYAPEVQNLLQQHIEARRRPDATRDLLSRERESEFIGKPSGEGTPYVGGESNGGGTYSLSDHIRRFLTEEEGSFDPLDPFNRKGRGKDEVTPENPTIDDIRKLREQGYEETAPDSGVYRKTGKGKPIVLEQDVPNRTPGKKGPKEEEIGKLRQYYDLARGLMSVDPPWVTSAAFRQAAPFAGTKNWFKSFGKAAEAFNSKEGYDAMMANMMDSPLFRPRKNPLTGKPDISFAQEIGLRMTDVNMARSARQEGIRSQLAERIPIWGKYVSASNRSFSGFLNYLRFSQLESLVRDGQIMAKAHNDPTLDLTRNIPLAKEVATFLNDATGSGKLETGIGKHQYNIEKHASVLADVFFSPRLMASRIRMLNPSTYIMASKPVRQMYLHGMLRSIGMWWGLAQLGKMAGGEVNTDPKNPDFGKVKFGNTRLDPGAGFQQYLVLAARTASGEYSSSTTGNTRTFGEGFNPPTRASNFVDFATNKMHPVAKLMWDIGNANERQPVYMMDRIAQMYLPMMTGDLMELAQSDPSLIPLVGAFSGLGGGSQTYTGEPTTPAIIPEDFPGNYKWSGGKVWPNEN